MGFDAVAAGMGGQIKRTVADGQIMGANMVGHRRNCRGVYGGLYREMDEQEMGVLFPMYFSSKYLRLSVQDAF